MRRLTTPSDPDQDLRPGDAVSFVSEGSRVRGIVRRVDEKAMQQMPQGLPYLVAIIDADPASGYHAGREYTIRAACLVRENDTGERPPRPPMSNPMAGGAAAASTMPRYLVGYLREGGRFPQQGALLVQASTLDEANAMAQQTISAELEADIAEGREDAGAMVMLVNAAEVTSTNGAAVLGQVSW
jgi:hypothetical protein